MRKFIKLLRKNWIFLIPFFLLLILIFSMWDTNYYFGGDFIFPLKPQDNIKTVVSLWVEQDGGSSYFKYVLFLWEGFFYLLSRINIPSYISIKILIAVLYVLGFVCTYFLYLLLFKESKYAHKKIAFLAALIFTLNPAAVLIITGTVPLYAFPICFFLLIKYLDTKNVLYTIPFAFFLNLGFFPDFPQAKLFVVFIVAVFFLLLLYSLLRKIKINSLILPLIFLMFISFMLNSFLLIPFFHDALGAKGLYQYYTTNVLTYDANADIYSASLPFITRFFNSNLIDKNSGLGHFLSNDFFDVWTFFLQFLAILSPFLITKKKEKRIIYLLLTSFVIFVFIAKGINPPFGEIYKWMIYHVPIAKLFRTSATSVIGGTVFYSILVAITIYYLSKKGRMFLGFFLIAHLMIFYPVYTGVKLENTFDLTLHQKGITLPTEYFTMGNLLDSRDKDGKILVLPPSDGYVGKNWGYNGQSLIAWLTHKPLFISNNNKMVHLDTSSAKELCFFTSLNNIRYFLREKDARGINVKKEIAYPGNKIMENQYFALQKTNDSCFLPHFYIPEKTIFLTGNTGSMADLSYLPIYKKGSAVYISDNSQKKTEDEIKTEQQVLSNVDDIVLEAVSTSDLRLPEKSYSPLFLGEDRLIGKIIYPYVRISPDSLFYPFILWKEDKLLTNGKLRDRQLLDVQLFLSSKRIKEISRWGIVNKPWQSVQERFQKIMGQAIETAVTSEQSKNNLKLVYEYLQGFRKDLKEIISMSPSWDKEKINSWGTVFDTLETETKNRYIPDDYDNLVYNFVTPNSGIFQGYLLLNKGKLLSDESAKIQVELNDNKIATYSAKEITGKNILNLGGLNLNASANTMKIQITNKQNLINALEWKTIEQGQAVTLDVGGIIFSPSLEVELGRVYSNPVVYQEIKTWEPGSTYLLRLQHTGQKGTALHLQIKEKKQIYDKDSDAWVIREENLFDQNFDVKVKKDDFKLLLTADKNSLSASIYISGINGVVEVEDVNLERIIFPRILLVNSKNQQNVKLDQPKVSFTKENPTKYLVKIEKLNKPIFLVFSEGFDKRWKIYKNGKGIGENNHFMVNGYANAWYLEKAGDQELTIEYWPQRLFYLGWFISLATLLLLCLYAVIKFLKKGKETYEEN